MVVNEGEVPMHDPALRATGILSNSGRDFIYGDG